MGIENEDTHEYSVPDWDVINEDEDPTQPCEPVRDEEDRKASSPFHVPFVEEHDLLPLEPSTATFNPDSETRAQTLYDASLTIGRYLKHKDESAVELIKYAIEDIQGVTEVTSALSSGETDILVHLYFFIRREKEVLENYPLEQRVNIVTLHQLLKPYYQQ